VGQVLTPKHGGTHAIVPSAKPHNVPAVKTVAAGGRVPVSPTVVTRFTPTGFRKLQAVQHRKPKL